VPKGARGSPRGPEPPGARGSLLEPQGAPGSPRGPWGAPGSLTHPQGASYGAVRVYAESGPRRWVVVHSNEEEEEASPGRASPGGLLAGT